MQITYSELWEMKELSQAKIVAGKAGLSNVICWFSMVEVSSYREVNYEDKLVFVAGIGMMDYEKDLTAIIECCAANGASGVVLEIGPYISDVSNTVKEMGDSLQLPILLLPFEVKISQITYKMTRMIFEKQEWSYGMRCAVDEIFLHPNSAEVAERLQYYGYRSNESYYCIAVEDDDHKIRDGLAAADKLQLVFLAVFEKLGTKGVLWTEHKEKLIFFIPWLGNDNIKMEVNEFITLVKKSRYVMQNDLCISVGVSAVFKETEKLYESVEQAIQALKMIHKCKKRNEVRIYEDIGIYRLFFEFHNKEELVNIYHDILDELLRYDEKNNTELVETLGVYLECGCNLALAMEVLMIHRNTIKYRIKRIQEILNVDFTNSNQCFNLELAYKIKKYLN